MWWLFDPALQWTIRLLLAGMLAVAALGKLRNRDAFRGIVHNYRLLPEALDPVVADALPVIELLTAAALLLPGMQVPGAVATIVLLLGFAMAMAVNLARGRREIDCGCFIGVLRQRIGWSLVIRNLLLSAAALPLLGGAAGRPLTWFDALTIVAASASLLLVYLAASRLLETVPLGEGTR